MPFVSQAQRAWMHANKPKMAKKWEKHTPKGKKLPKRKKKKKKYKKKKTLKNNFEIQLDHVLGLINEDEFIVFESDAEDPQATTGVNKGPKKGASKGPKKGSAKK